MNPPLTPLGCDLRDFPSMLLDVGRLRDSDLTLISSGDEFKAAVLLWTASWHQVPAGSLPDDERMLAGLAKVDRKTWVKVRAVALRGWSVASDGRLYHRAVAEKALGCWINKLNGRISSGAGHAKRYGGEFDRGPLDRELEQAGLLLQALAPKSRALHRVKPVKAADEAATGSATGTPPACQENRTEGKTLPEGAQGAPADPGKEAWDRAVSLLTTRGGASERSARSFFGKLLSSSGLEARDLLPSVVKAETVGTADPQGYLTKAARALAERRPGGEAASLGPSAWGADEWRTALAVFRERGAWSDEFGPRPGEPGCRVPSELLAGEGAEIVRLPIRVAG